MEHFAHGAITERFQSVCLKNRFTVPHRTLSGPQEPKLSFNKKEERVKHSAVAVSQAQTRRGGKRIKSGMFAHPEAGEERAACTHSAPCTAGGGVGGCGGV